MSEQQKPDKEAEDTSMVVDKQESRSTRHSRHNKSEKYGAKRPDEADISKMDLKNNRRKQSQSKISENKDAKNSDSSENITKNVINKTPLTSKTNPPESITLESIDTKQKKAAAIPEQLAQVTPVQPISTDIEAISASREKPVESEKPADSEVHLGTDKSEREAEEASLDEITELRTQPKFSEWSDEEEAGGLSRSSSRASRVSRAVRQFFCCGVAYEAPDEDNISYHRAYAI